MKTFDFYNDGMPEMLERLSETPAMQRLCNVGMNCGCEYTSFPLFARIEGYSRHAHSVGTGMITWHFTRDPAAAAAALLHDIATPVFAHTVDFINGDHVLQESTEEMTAAVISSSPEICTVLSLYGLKPEDVSDYHRFPVADNDSPKLSADRLEYTLGNGVNYGFIAYDEAAALYADLSVGTNEYGQDELCFSDAAAAERFAFLSLECSKVYVSPEDRYSMQILSELLKEAMAGGVILPEDLMKDEPYVINKLQQDPESNKKWKDFTSLSIMVSAEEYPQAARTVPAKKRRIDPYISGKGRVSMLSPSFRKALDEFMQWDFTIPIAGK